MMNAGREEPTPPLACRLPINSLLGWSIAYAHAPIASVARSERLGTAVALMVARQQSISSEGCHERTSYHLPQLPLRNQAHRVPGGTFDRGDAQGLRRAFRREGCRLREARSSSTGSTGADRQGAPVD